MINDQLKILIIFVLLKRTIRNMMNFANLDPTLSENYTYTTWKYCKTNMVRIQCIPPKIGQTYKDLSLGVFPHFTDQFNRLVSER